MQERSPNNNPKSGINDFAFILRTFAFSVEVMLRSGFGERYIGWQALAVVPLMFLWGVFFPHDWPWMIGYLVLYVTMYCRANREILQISSVDRPHTRYNGFPRLLRFFPKIGERRMKKTIEPLIVFLYGMLTCIVSPCLGSFLIIAGISLCVTEISIDSYERHRVLDLHDSVLDQKSMAERFRRMNRDRY